MQKDLLVGTVEVDESYFGPTRPRGVLGKLNRGRGTLKQPVFERGGRVFTEIVPDANKPTLQRLIRDHIALEAVIVSDGWPAYDGLVDVGYDRHLRIKKARPKTFSENGVHINGIESFWSFTGAAARVLPRFVDMDDIAGDVHCTKYYPLFDPDGSKPFWTLDGEEVTRVENLAVPADPMLQADTGRRPVREWSDTLAAGSRASRRISRAI